MSDSDEARVLPFAAGASQERKPEPDEQPQANRPTRPLPTDRITFGRQLDLLRGWAAASVDGTRPALLREVEKIVNMKGSTISLANPFFTDIGLLAKGDPGKGGFLPAPEVVSFHRAHQWNPETAAEKLRPVLERSWFAAALLPRLSVVGSISQDDAIQALAEAVAAGTTYRGKLVLLLEYLEVARLIVRDGEAVRTARAVSRTGDSTPDAQTGGTAAAAAGEARPVPEREQPPTRVATSFMQPTDGTVQFHISVRVDMSEFASWSPDRITAFFGGIAQVLAAKGQVEEGAASE